MFWWLFASDSLRALEARLVRLERKIDILLKKQEIEYEHGLPGRVVELINAGQKIAAIKAYREETGAGLKEAKDAVERY